MIHMGSDHRCVMATFTITVPVTNIHIKNTREQDTIEDDERGQAEENIEAVKSELEKTRRSLRKSNIPPPQIMPQRKQKVEEGNHERKRKNAAAAGAICENAEAKTEVERMCKGNIMSDSVVTANETDGWHRGRAILYAASEGEDHIAFNHHHVKHDMNDDPKESENSAEATVEEHLDRDTVNDDADNVETAKEAVGRHRQREDDFTDFHNDLVEHNQEEVKVHPQKPRRPSPWRLQGCQVMNVPIETQQIMTRAMVITFGPLHLVAEAGSVVLHVRNSMNEVTDDEDIEGSEEEGGTAAAREAEVISRKVAEIRRLIELRRSTPKEEKQRMKELSKSIIKCIRDKKRVIRQQVNQKDIKNERGKVITLSKGIDNVCGEFYNIIYDDNEQDEYGNESNIDVHISDTGEMTRIPEITSEELKVAMRELRKDKSPDSDGIRAEDIKACDEETEEMLRQIFNETIKQIEFTLEACKNVKIKVLHNKGDVENVGNYRPIGSVLALCKLFSTILYGILYPRLDQEQAEDQAGFRSSYRTTDHFAT